MDIAHSQYHKHGAYILQHADQAGFSRQEQLRLSLLVRLHRRKFNPALADVLVEKDARRAVVRLAPLLRLAVLLHRSRAPLAPPLADCELAAGKGWLSIRFPAGWLDAHPLTRADLEQEADYLAAGKWRLEFA